MQIKLNKEEKEQNSKNLMTLQKKNQFSPRQFVATPKNCDICHISP